jgi:hypothetical protein
MRAKRVDIAIATERDGWLATVSVNDATATIHRVHVSRAEHVRYGGGDITELVRRSLEFLLARESNTSILREFSLGTIERYFPEFAATIGGVRYAALRCSSRISSSRRVTRPMSGDAMRHERAAPTSAPIAIVTMARRPSSISRAVAGWNARTSMSIAPMSAPASASGHGRS